MTYKKRYIIIISVVSAVVVLAVVFLSLGLTVWRPKTTEEWLKDFSAALELKQDESDRKTEKSIVITEGDSEVARYYQLVEVHTQGGRPVAHLIAEEKFLTLGTTEFDTRDEYYFYDGTMYMSRDNGGEVTGTKFGSTWEVFWEVVNENMGKNTSAFDKETFTDLDITHADGVHSLIAKVAEDKKDKLFGEVDGAGEMSGINMKIELDDSLELTSFKLSYVFKDTQVVTTEITVGVSDEIEIK